MVNQHHLGALTRRLLQHRKAGCDGAKHPIDPDCAFHLQTVWTIIGESLRLKGLLQEVEQCLPFD